jgi:hypothetical protein
MLYMVQVGASMERANTIDAGEGPGPVRIVRHIDQRGVAAGPR